MSPLVDNEGRLGGVINLVDALCLAFFFGLIPVAYTSWLLFQPAQPQIVSVERSEITAAEERIAAGQPIRLKVKVRGHHLTPMLRAYIGGVPAMGFTFEGPTSADVIIGENVSPGIHDLVLYDGPQEVARAQRAVSILPSAGPVVRAAGAFTLLDHATANRLQVGQIFRVAEESVAEIVALGAVSTDRRDIKVSNGAVQVPAGETWGREAIVRLRCDAHPDTSRCRIGGTAIADATAQVVNVPGSDPPLRLRVQGIAPDATPTNATVRVRLAGDPVLSTIAPGNRDIRWPSLDGRAAIVKSVRRSGGAVELFLQLGVDRATDGWRYYSERVVAGGPFVLVTERFSGVGTVIELVVGER